MNVTHVPRTKQPRIPKAKAPPEVVAQYAVVLTEAPKDADLHISFDGDESLAEQAQAIKLAASNTGLFVRVSRGRNARNLRVRFLTKEQAEARQAIFDAAGIKRSKH